MNFSYVTSPAEVLQIDTELRIRDEGDSIIWGPDSRRNRGSVPAVLRWDEISVFVEMLISVHQTTLPHTRETQCNIDRHERLPYLKISNPIVEVCRNNVG